MNEDTIRAIKTVCGGIFHAVSNYPERQIHVYRDFEILESMLKLNRSTIYCIEQIPFGFKITTRHLSFKYTHNSYSLHKRVIELKY